MRARLFSLAIAMGVTIAPAFAEEVTVRTGTDLFISGDTVLTEIENQGDVFVASETTTVDGAVLGDLHVAGFDVMVATDVSEDLYAAGASVEIRGDVGGDMTAAGFTLRTTPTAETAGNARLGGNTVTIEGPIAGALSAVGRTVVLNAPVEGDVRVTAKTLAFGDDAVVTGTLYYSSQSRISVPASVAAPERVVFSAIEFDGDWDDFGGVLPIGEMPVFPKAASVFGAFVVSLLFFMILGALALGFMPNKLERLRQGISTAPGWSMVSGALGLSLLIGIVPVSALTVVGIPFIPIAVLAIIVIWTLGYALGGYAVALFVWRSLGEEAEPGKIVRVLLLGGAVTVIALLNFIPFIGWVANFTLVLLGIGAITRMVFGFFIEDVDLPPAMDSKPSRN
ncbi:hypothetical protein [Boseongicola aestuarii]|uniref:DUF8173 domain-containing protein n=1 Tax=Boseongicola aestuarii TaxID=1470561 RepID=A0A238IUA4_9RHOB|nr:hypothetical protein [Boseongicola aestuarii]SMX21958.1 hypothetical protein BOA8489_00045 [Boseongicola aestuarii]